MRVINLILTVLQTLKTLCSLHLQWVLLYTILRLLAVCDYIKTMIKIFSSDHPRQFGAKVRRFGNSLRSVELFIRIEVPDILRKLSL
jgi:hypothetical protein